MAGGGSAPAPGTDHEYAWIVWVAHLHGGWEGEGCLHSSAYLT